MRKLRISAISYLNTAPLMWDFEHAEAGRNFDISYTLPSGCARSLADGTAGLLQPSQMSLGIPLKIRERADVFRREVGEYAVEVDPDPANLGGVGIARCRRPESADNSDGGCGNYDGRDQTSQCHAKPLMVKE